MHIYHLPLIWEDLLSVTFKNMYMIPILALFEVANADFSICQDPGASCWKGCGRGALSGDFSWDTGWELNCIFKHFRTKLG